MFYNTRIRDISRKLSDALSDLHELRGTLLLMGGAVRPGMDSAYRYVTDSVEQVESAKASIRLADHTARGKRHGP